MFHREGHSAPPTNNPALHSMSDINLGDIIVVGNDFAMVISDTQAIVACRIERGEYYFVRIDLPEEIVLSLQGDYIDDQVLTAFSAIRCALGIPREGDLPTIQVGAHKYSARFKTPNFAVMRHAKDNMHGLVAWSEEICRVVTAELANQISVRKVAIRCSPLNRAKLTGKVVAQALHKAGVEVTSVCILDWLKSDSLKLDDTSAKMACAPESDTFTLFITHLPDIEQFLGVGATESSLPNNTIISQSFLISKLTP